MSQLSIYPSRAAERDRWIVDRRPARNEVDPSRPYAFLLEQEHTHTGEIAPVATIFLTGSECPWRCVMCDLWKNTLTHPTPPGAIPEQIRFALAALEPAQQVKLYNSGSFFDRQSVPPGDYPAIASLTAHFERVIVESHPLLIGDPVLHFRDLVGGKLEVAMGLETVHPEAFEKINKRVTLEQFAGAASRLANAAVDLRVFVLVQPPFVPSQEALHWAQRSLDFAFDCGATAVTLIPTRGGNGAMEELAREGNFTSPKLAVVEASLAYGLSLRRGRVFVDLWDLDRISACPECYGPRLRRLSQINLSQVSTAPEMCSRCGGLS